MTQNEEKRFCRIVTIIIIIIWGFIILILIMSKTNFKSKKNAIELENKTNIVQQNSLEDEVLLIQQRNWEDRNSINTPYEIIESVEATPEYVAIAEEQLLLIPSQIISYFRDNGWKIRMENADIGKKYFSDEGDTVRGFVKPDKKIIVIKNSEKAAFFSVPHEFGHYLDIVMEYPSSTDEFKEIYREEVEILKNQRDIGDETLLTNEKEFFAETFEYLVRNSSKCTPRAREYVQECIYEFIRFINEQSSDCSFFKIS